MADTFSVRLTEDLRVEVDKMAEMSHRSRAYIIKAAVEAYVEDHRAYKAAVHEALVEADKGVFISGETIHTWLDALRTDPNAADPEPDIFPDTNT